MEIVKLPTKKGVLYLIPSPLGGNTPLEVLPLTVRKVIEEVTHFVVENEKDARSFIKRMNPKKDQDSLTLYPLNKFTLPEEILTYLDPIQEGITMGVISDAGCPGVADPGALIVSKAHDLKIKIKPLVGPSSILLALMASGMNGQSFAFNGYLPIDKLERKNKIKVDFEHLGISDIFVQDNHSVSEQTGTLRGLHFQVPPHAQGKLVRCGRGSIFDVAVDIRRGSPTYGSWVGYELTAENGHQLYIPGGFAHGFQTLKPDSEIVYKCTQYFASEAEGAVRWDDPDIKINWPLNDISVLSEKDMAAPFLAALDSPFAWDGV